MSPLEIPPEPKVTKLLVHHLPPYTGIQQAENSYLTLTIVYTDNDGDVVGQEMVLPVPVSAVLHAYELSISRVTPK